MRRLGWIAGLVCVVGGALPAVAEPVVYARDLSLSPDGSTLAFTWAGDIWTAPTTGGVASRLTVNPAEDSNPVWSNDGRWIAFASDRHGAGNVFIMSRDGDAVRRVTVSDRSETPTGWTQDDAAILYHSRIAGEIANEPHVYRVDARGGQPWRMMECNASEAHESADGRHVAFVRGWSPMARTGYRGSANRDVWIRETSTGRYSRLTDFDGTDAQPAWDANSAGVYFLSDRGGRLNVWHQPISGGAALQITRMDGDRVRDFAVSRDGRTLVFAHWDKLYVASPPAAPPRELVIDAPADSARRPYELRTLTREADEVEPSPDGKELALVVRGEICVVKTEPDKPTRRVTQSAARDRHVTWSPDGKALFFVSDLHGQEDVYRATSAEQPARALSDSLRFRIERVTDNPQIERAPAISPDGKALSFVRNRGDLIVRDVVSGVERRVLESWNVPSYRWSPDSEWIAYSVADEEYNDDVWVVRADGSQPAVNISRHPDNDSDPAWSADGNILAFTGRRAGHDSDLQYVFLSPRLAELSSVDRDEYFQKAAEKVKKRKAPVECAASGAIHLGEPSASQPATATASAGAPSSPASRPIASAPTTDRAAVAMKKVRDGLRSWLLDEATSKPATRPSKSAQSDEERKKADDEPEYKWDLATAYRRVRNVTRLPENQATFALSPDGAALVFVSAHEGTPALFSVKWNGEDRKRILSQAVQQPQWARDGSRLFYLSAGAPGSCNASGGDPKTHAFSLRMAIDFAEEASQKWDDAARFLGLGFYHPTLKGLDWPVLSARYRALALRCRTYAEFNEIFNLFQGELNASHLGISGPSSGRVDEAVGYLGCSFDPSFPGPGLRVSSVLRDSPADRQESRLFVGDVLLTVSGREVGPLAPLNATLIGAVGEQVIVEIAPGAARIAGEAQSQPAGAPGDASSHPATAHVATSSAPASSAPIASRAATASSAATASAAAPREVVIRPVGAAQIQSLGYEAWVERNRAFVEENSGGRVGYAHISAMAEPQFNAFERDLYAAAHGKDALIIDVRYNGGGWTADWIMAVLTVQRHAYTVGRGGKAGYPQDRLIFYAWTKPAVMMCNQFSYSNAEIVSHAFKSLKRGPLVGMTTFGAVISTGSYSLIDGTTIRMPFRGWYRLSDGKDMEEQGAVPDVLVPQTPDDEERGGVAQLEAAVRAALAEVKQP